jgi:hypothetical protein
MSYNDEQERADIVERVRTLFRAENGPGGEAPDDFIVSPDNSIASVRRAAEAILAVDYVPIIRGKGQMDRDRDETLARMIGASPLFRRHVSRAEIEVKFFLESSVAIVRALIPTTDSQANPPISSPYRNLQVFIKREGSWRCVAWQVTRIQ